MVVAWVGLLDGLGLLWVVELLDGLYMVVAWVVVVGWVVVVAWVGVVGWVVVVAWVVVVVGCGSCITTHAINHNQLAQLYAWVVVVATTIVIWMGWNHNPSSMGCWMGCAQAWVVQDC